MSVLTDIQDWFYDHCDGDWEHGYGVRMTSLDNPGWSLEISLEDTELEQVTFERVVIEREEHDWIHCSVSEGFFRAAGGPKNLEEMLNVFLNWARSTT